LAILRLMGSAVPFVRPRPGRQPCSTVPLTGPISVRPILRLRHQGLDDVVAKERPIIVPASPEHPGLLIHFERSSLLQILLGDLIATRGADTRNKGHEHNGVLPSMHGISDIARRVIGSRAGL